MEKAPSHENSPLLGAKDENRNENHQPHIEEHCEISNADEVVEQPEALSSAQSSQSQRRLLLLQGRLLLFAVAFIYGSLNVCLRMVYERPGAPTASVLSTVRGWLSVGCFFPLLQFAKPHPYNNVSNNPDDIHNAPAPIHITKDNRHFLFCRFVVELAVFNFGTQGLINLGLVTTESARASFLVQLSVVITPALSAVFGHKVHAKVWTACVMALIGLYVLSNTGVGFSVTFTAGDLCCLGSAFCWSYYIYRMSAWGSYFDDVTSMFWKNILLAVLYSIWMTCSMMMSNVSLWEGWKDPISWMILLYSALGPCTIADIIQQKAQSTVPAAESNVILSMEPVFTAVLGLIFLHELLSWHELVGGALIVGASVLASY
jgi:drug/metabolite transporter (DMT)-like permease